MGEREGGRQEIDSERERERRRMARRCRSGLTTVKSIFSRSVHTAVDRTIIYNGIGDPRYPREVYLIIPAYRPRARDDLADSSTDLSILRPVCSR